MKLRYVASALALLLGTATAAQADTDPSDLIVTASNTSPNRLLVYDTADNLLQSIPTQGQGGAGGNAGGVQTQDGLVAVVNFGSQDVSIFRRDGAGFRLSQLIPTASSPVSLARWNSARPD